MELSLKCKLIGRASSCVCVCVAAQEVDISFLCVLYLFCRFLTRVYSHNSLCEQSYACGEGLMW